MKRWMITGLLLVILAGCGGTAKPAGQTQTVDGLTITLTALAEPAMSKPQQWTVKLADAAGQPVTGADVYLELIMTTMTMGQNKPLASDNGDGTYSAAGVYSMDGEWHVAVHAEVAGVEHVATFNVSVVK
jgi:hypothetical protein